MRKVLLLLLLIGAVPFASFAQSDDVPAIEVFGGYSYLRTFSRYDDDAHGWNTSVSGNVTRHFAVKADFAGHYQRYNVNRINVDYSLHTFMFGPQANFRVTDRVNPFSTRCLASRAIPHAAPRATIKRSSLIPASRWQWAVA